MERRNFLKGAAVAGVGTAASVGLSSPALSQGREKLTMVMTWSRGLAGVWDAAERVANSVNAITDGNLEIELKAQGELITGIGPVFDAVVSGQADMYHAADYYFVGQHPAFGFFTAMPFGMTANEIGNWYYHMGGHELHRELGEEFGLVSFLGGNTGAQAGGWFRKEIKSADDFKGLKFRMPGLGGKVLASLGASVQTLPGGEVYQALASGAIDGTEWIGPWADEAAGFAELTKIYYTSGFHEPGPALSVAINQDRFNGLKPAHQKAIEICSAECHQWSLHQFWSKNAVALERLKAAGVKTLEFPDDVWDAFGAASKDLIEESRGDALFAKTHDSFAASMKASASWLEASDGVYTRQRTRVLG